VRSLTLLMDYTGNAVQTAAHPVRTRTLMNRIRRRPVLAWLIAFAITLQGLAAHAMVLPAQDSESSLEAALRVICTGHGIAQLPEPDQAPANDIDHDCSLCQCSPSVAKTRTDIVTAKAFTWVPQAPALPASDPIQGQSTPRSKAPRAPPAFFL